jgi:hypothetical protein
MIEALVREGGWRRRMVSRRGNGTSHPSARVPCLFRESRTSSDELRTEVLLEAVERTGYRAKIVGNGAETTGSSGGAATIEMPRVPARKSMGRASARGQELIPLPGGKHNNSKSPTTKSLSGFALHSRDGRI